MRILVIGIILYFTSALAHACSCADLDLKESIRNSKYIFTARILSVEINKKAKDFIRSVSARIDVTESIKGNPKFKKLYSGFGMGDCGIVFNVGWEYIFYTDNDTIVTCSFSGIYPGKENDNGYFEKLKEFVETGKDFDPYETYFDFPEAKCM